MTETSVHAAHPAHEDHTKVYLAVFIALMVLTGVTVAVSYLKLPIVWAVAVAMVVAITKGSLVGAYFMHLVSEKFLIRSIVAMSFFFFAILLALPLLDIASSHSEAARPEGLPAAHGEPAPAAHGGAHVP